MPDLCAKCDKEIEKQQGYEYQEKLFCEDCYMDILSPAKACDPWAVHSAQKFLRGKDKFATLTPQQLKLVNYLKQKGEATLEELIEDLSVTEEDVRREFAVLRHMEILRATKRGGKVCYLLF